MNKKDILDWFSTKWGVGIAGTTEASALLSIKLNTLQTRLSAGQAVALRDRAGPVRSRVTMAGYHLAYNLLNDVLLKHSLFADEDTLCIYAQWIGDHIVRGKQNTEAVFVARVEDGKTIVEDLDDWSKLRPYGGPVVVIPIGQMILSLAATLYTQLSEDAAAWIMAEARRVREGA